LEATYNLLEAVPTSLPNNTSFCFSLSLNDRNSKETSLDPRENPHSFDSKYRHDL
jgi:hypothetical protein